MRPGIVWYWQEIRSWPVRLAMIHCTTIVGTIVSDEGRQTKCRMKKVTQIVWSAAGMTLKHSSTYTVIAAEWRFSGMAHVQLRLSAH